MDEEASEPIDEQAEAEYQKLLLAELFKQRDSSPRYWQSTAQDLHEASSVIWRDWLAARDRLVRQAQEKGVVRLFNNRGLWLAPISLMLAGMALEDVMKAKLHELGERISKKGHDLVALANQLGLELTAEELALLPDLTTYVTWLGRYPTPRAADAMDSLAVGLRDWDVFDRLYRRLGGWTYSEGGS